MVELLKQGQFRPYHVTDQVISIYAGTRGHLDDIPLSRVAEFEEKLLKHFRNEFPEVHKELTDKKEMTEALEGKIKEIIGNFKRNFAQRE
jgi:F-type H+-transporting ATPase subunit alpha